MRGTAFAAALVAAAVSMAGARAQTVDVAFVLAVDVSGSVDAGEYVLQHEGIARAFESKAVVDTIRGGTARRDRRAGDRVVRPRQAGGDRRLDPHQRRRDRRRLRRQACGRASAAPHGLTAIGDALLAAAAAFKRLRDQPDRRIIDLSGDGMANIGPKPDEVRDALVAQGITINGLAILKTEPWLDQYYDQYVVGGDHSFLLQVEDFQSFATAMQQKLLGEIAARPGRRPRRRRFRCSRS